MAGKNRKENMSTSSGIKVVDESQVIVENQTNTDEAPMAVLPLNSSTKLDQEPNPFEQSFSGAAVDDKLKDKLKLPPVASITSPSPVMNNLTNNHANNTAVIGGGILPKEVTSQFTWDTLRTGPLSPSMLQGPANPEEYYASNMIHNKPNSQLGSTSYSARSSFSSSAADLQYHHHQPVKVEQEMFIQPTTTTTRQQKTRQQTRSRQTSASSNRKRSVSQPEEDDQSMDSNESATKGNRRRSSALTVDSTEEEDTEHSKKKTRTSSSKDPEDDEKRKNFLERNRIAALKCRQRKKQWLNNLQAKVEFLTNDNERLQIQSESLKEEIVNLKTLLLAHKDCPVAQANGFHPNTIQKSMPSMLPTQMLRQTIPASMMQQAQPAYLTNTMRNQSSSGTTNINISTTGPPPAPPSLAAAAVSSSSLPPNSSPISQQQQYQRNMGIPVQPQPATNTQQGMMAAGGGGSSSSVLRF